MIIDSAREVNLDFAPYFSKRILGEGEMMTADEAVQVLSFEKPLPNDTVELYLSLDFLFPELSGIGIRTNYKVVE